MNMIKMISVKSVLSRIINTVKYRLYFAYLFCINKEARSFSGDYNSGIDKKVNIKNKRISELKIAFICDDMTYNSFEGECECVYLTPNNWYSVLEQFEPDILFCESAWSGLSMYKHCWRGRLYKNHAILFETRKDLFRILDYCKNKNIISVFWNKEDPVYFDDKAHDFADTALYFDYIFTTCIECVDGYKQKGHKNVFPLMFGFSPLLFNPINSFEKEEIAVFAGSWYSEHQKRCQDMIKAFNLVKSKNIRLKIYDRYYNKGTGRSNFPTEYQESLNAGILYKNLSSVLKNVKYAININTVTNSETMFARRVFELMACNVIVISNESLGLRKLFPDNIWFIDSENPSFDLAKVREENLENVLKNHTNQKRLLQMVKILGFDISDEKKLVYHIFLNQKYEESKQFYLLYHDSNQVGIWFDGIDFYEILNNQKIKKEQLFQGNNYFIFTYDKMICNEKVEKLLLNFSFLDETIGIGEGEERFSVVENTMNVNVLFHCAAAQKLVSDVGLSFKKYYI